MKTIEYTNLPEFVLKAFAPSEKLHSDIESALSSLFPGSIKVNWNAIVRCRTESCHCYLDNGNTPCPGKRYDYLSIIPLFRESKSRDMELSACENNYANSAIYIMSDCTVRDYDLKINRDQYQHLYISPLIDYDLANHNQRIAYSSNGSITLTKNVLYRLAMKVADVQREHDVVSRVDSYVGTSAV